MTELSHVDETLAIATVEIVSAIMPQGFDLSTSSPTTLADCTAYFAVHGKICVDPSYGNTSIFADQTAHCSFNAWHDWCHVKGQCTFDLHGERRVDDIMQQHLAKWWVSCSKPVTKGAYERAAEVLRMFNLGRLEYWLAYGEQPANPRQFLFGYLTAREKIAIPSRCADRADDAAKMA